MTRMSTELKWNSSPASINGWPQLVAWQAVILAQVSF